MTCKQPSQLALSIPRESAWQEPPHASWTEEAQAHLTVWAESLGINREKEDPTVFLEDRKLIRSAGRFFEKLDYNLLIIHNDTKHRITSGKPVHKTFYAPKLLFGSKGWRLYVAPKGIKFSIERLGDLSDKLAWHWFGGCECSRGAVTFS